MASINITIPDDKIDSVVDAMCEYFGYQTSIVDDEGGAIPNPETKNQFAKKQLKQFIKKVYRKNEVRKARATVVDVEL